MKRGQMLFSGFSLKKVARGFTLLEMLFVVVIVGVMSTIIGPRFFNQLMKSQNTAVVSQLSSFASALDVYLLDNGHYPTTEQGLQALLHAPVGETKWAGPYLSQDQIPADPFGNSYIYTCPALSPSYALYSQGRDLNSSSDDISASDLTNGLNASISFSSFLGNNSNSSTDSSGSSADQVVNVPVDDVANSDGVTAISSASSSSSATAMMFDPQGFTDAVGIIQ